MINSLNNKNLLKSGETPSSQTSGSMNFSFQESKAKISKAAMTSSEKDNVMRKF